MFLHFTFFYLDDIEYLYIYFGQLIHMDTYSHMLTDDVKTICFTKMKTLARSSASGENLRAFAQEWLIKRLALIFIFAK